MLNHFPGDSPFGVRVDPAAGKLRADSTLQSTFCRPDSARRDGKNFAVEVAKEKHDAAVVNA